MYLLTIRDGLQTRHIGPYPSPAAAAGQIEALLAGGGERAHWQIHELESPLALVAVEEGAPPDAKVSGVAAA
jgi:hypothetical protein